MTKKKGFAAVAAVFCALFAFLCVTLGSVAPAQAQPGFLVFEAPYCQGAPHVDPVPCEHPNDLSFVNPATGVCEVCPLNFAVFAYPDCQGPPHYDMPACDHPVDQSFMLPTGECFVCPQN
ncbi:MAG: hypothetical protein AB4352_03150 [Hormoscilla sp.]